MRSGPYPRERNYDETRGNISAHVPNYVNSTVMWFRRRFVFCKLQYPFILLTGNIFTFL